MRYDWLESFEDDLPKRRYAVRDVFGPFGGINDVTTNCYVVLLSRNIYYSGDFYI